MGKKQITVNNHYVSKVFLKSWLSQCPNQNKELLLAFDIESQDFVSPTQSSKNVYFAAEDYLYTLKNENEDDDWFEYFLQSGENSWGKILSTIKSKGILSFKDLHEFDNCLLLLVSLSQRSKHRVNAYENFIKKKTSFNDNEVKQIALNIIALSIDTRCHELANREINLIECKSNELIINESPFFDLKTSKFQRDEALIAITPNLLLQFTSVVLDQPKINHVTFESSDEAKKKVQAWNHFMIESARQWLVGVNNEDNKKLFKKELTFDKVRQRRATDKLIISIDGKERHEEPILYD